MDREQAIKELQESHDIMRNHDIDESESYLMQALNMAIKALEQEPCEDAISRSEAIKAIEERAKRIKNGDTLNGLAGAVGILFELPSVKPQPCEDAISRQAVLDLLEDTNNGWIINEVSQLPSVKPQDCDTCEVGNPCL